MSASYTPTPKVPPSLLADTPANVHGGRPEGSRILANLEGRVVPPAARSREGRRQRSVLAIAALLMTAAAFGVWHVFERSVPAVHETHVAGATVAPDSGARGAAKVTRLPAGALPRRAATIVADEESVAVTKPASGTVASATVRDDARLSRALANDARVAGAGAASGSAAPPAGAATEANHKRVAKRAETRVKAKAAGHTKAEALAKKQPDTQTAARKDDSDADLLAVLVARTKPADCKDAIVQAAKVKAGKLTLAEEVKACGERGSSEDQRCRRRVCDGHWGKDPACPAAARAH
ncbi:hypothetical protein [Paraburkholderia dinghuensis]|uniref:Uncharacterized protein n=1 Tax=Paraburkholderia dinghuensis TaxID=2305225 RepID=A0A3N6NEN3_9BURK|nr:hypothetical protein [Paraburkholderia dinghuensis]RQH09891.1 hypothetical protein D1Y85_01745 [Paraburkholderia dinghuensis]